MVIKDRSPVVFVSESNTTFVVGKWTFLACVSVLVIAKLLRAEP